MSNLNPSGPHRKKLKNILSFYKKKNEDSSSSIELDISLSTPICEVQNLSEAPRVESQTQRDESPREGFDQTFHINSLHRDPGLRRLLEVYPVNEQDNVRRAYISLGPCQPKLKEYPSSLDGYQFRQFRESWFKVHPWLEYSVDKDKAFCFPCFLFDDKLSHRVFIVDGFDNWKRVGGKACSLQGHVGIINSPHHLAMQKWSSMRNYSNHIEKVIQAQSSQQIMQNRLRILTTIHAIRYLAKQALAFRGHDECVNSSNRGNFIEMIKEFASMNVEIEKVVLENAPGNAKYTSPTIQKDILHIFASMVRNKIVTELGGGKFCILVDEELDESGQEQMAIILRFVDCGGFIRDRFFDIVSVEDTNVLTLKEGICKVLSNNLIMVDNMCGQGYDGASNMRGAWNGLQALFRQDCPYAYYVHCFAHRLQLALNGAAKEVGVVWRFFSMLNNVVIFVTCSAKRRNELKVSQALEIQELLDAGELETGQGANQIRSLQRLGATRWGSHFRSITRLIDLFKHTKMLLQEIRVNGPTQQFRGEAESNLFAVVTFEFVFCLLLMEKVMGLTDFLCQAFQRKSQDIVSAINFIANTKMQLQELRDDGWDDFLRRAVSFCEQHSVDVPDMGAQYMMGTGRSCQQKDIITVAHYYRINVFYLVIDSQLAELTNKFPEQTVELLILSSSLYPRNSFKSFNIENIYNLAQKFYPQDFDPYELKALQIQLGFFKNDIHLLPCLKNISSLPELCQRLVETNLAKNYHLIDRLIRLVLTLPVSTATTERVFSSMRIIKNRLRNQIEDEFLADCMILHIEREFVDTIDTEAILSEFDSSKERRVQLKIR